MYIDERRLERVQMALLNDKYKNEVLNFFINIFNLVVGDGAWWRWGRAGEDRWTDKGKVLTLFRGDFCAQKSLFLVTVILNYY